MSIDITNNIVFDAGSGGLEASRKIDSEGTARLGDADSTVRAEYEAIIGAALEAGDSDLQVVAEARRLLETGLLDTTEAAESAAERILVSGI